MLFNQQDLQRVDIQHVRSLPFLERLRHYAPFILKAFKFLMPVLRWNAKTKMIALGIIEACEALIEENEQ